MAAGLKKGEEEVKDVVTESKMKWKSQNVGDEKEDISSTDAGEEMVEDAGHGPGTDVSKQGLIATINLLERMTRLRMLPTRPSEETKEERTPMIQNLKSNIHLRNNYGKNMSK